MSKPTRTSKPEGTFEITLVLRRRNQLPRNLVAGPDTISPETLRDLHGAHPDDLHAVASAASAHGATVARTHPASRRVHLQVTAEQAEAMFGITMRQTSSLDGLGRDVTHRTFDGDIRLPRGLGGAVEAVLGLDARPIATPRFHPARSAAPSSYTPVQVADAYGYSPAADSGSGQTIAIVELGGGYKPAQIADYFTGLGLAAPRLSDVSVDGGKNTPDGPDGADGEVQLDIEVAGATAPGAAITVYFAPNTDAGFLNAVAEATHATPTPAAISISWGGPESSWSKSAMKAFDQALEDAAALGITVTAASGDASSGDGERGRNVDFPASSPHALACGGTNLAIGGNGMAETVWYEGPNEGTGGGISTVFSTPDYQTQAGIKGAGRSVPDVAGNADPATGYKVTVDGEAMVIGGTSAVAPLWAAIMARIAQASGRPVGLAQTTLYAGAKAGAAAPGFNDIVSGSNGAYKAGVGFDCCTGLGSPSGPALTGLFGTPAGDGGTGGTGTPTQPPGQQPPGQPPAGDLCAEILAYLDAEFTKIKDAIRQLFQS